MTVFVILGVSGVGKTTVGELAAQHLQLPFIEADDFHPQSNVDKMSAGIPLTEEDRIPWIDRLIEAINARVENDLVLACSALTRFVRDRLRSELKQPVTFMRRR